MANKDKKVTDESGTMEAATAENTKGNEYANFNKPMAPMSPSTNEGSRAAVPGVDPGATYAEVSEEEIDPKLMEAAALRPRGAQGGSQTDRLTAIQQEMQGLGRKDRPSYDGLVKSGDVAVSMAGYPAEEPGKETNRKRDGVAIRSADNRALFVSINGQRWEGKEIYVPEKYVEEAKRILNEGGYYIKE